MRRILVFVGAALSSCSGSGLNADAIVLPPAFAGETYLAVLNGRGGEPPYSWRIASGALPEGLQLEINGAVFGVPQQDGDFPIEFALGDASGAEAFATFTLQVRPASGPTTSCEAPATLSLAPGSARISGRFPGGVSSSPERPCRQDGAVARVFYQVEVPPERRLSVAVTSDQPAQVTVLEASCPAEVPVSTCGNDLQVDTPPGSYLVEVIGQPNATMDLSVALIPAVDLGSCARPEVLDVSTEVATLKGRAESPLPEGLECPASGDGYVYVFDLTQEQDLRIDVDAPYGLFADDCLGVEISNCRFNAPQRLPNIPAGRYVLVIAREAGSSFEGRMELLPPSERPSNDRCEMAVPVPFVSDVADLAGSTLGALPDLNALCRGEEHALFYELNLTEESWLLFDGPNDVAISVLESCAGDSICDVEGQCTRALNPGRYVVKVGRSEQNRHLPFAATARRTPVVVLDNDTCLQAELLPGSPGRYEVAGSVRNAGDFLRASCSQDAGEVFYQIDLSEPSDVRFEFSNERFRSTFAYLGSACSSVAKQCGPRAAGLLALPAGSHFFAVESPYRSNESVYCRDGDPADFTFAVDITSAPPNPVNDECSGQITVPLSLGAAPVEVNGTLRGATDDQRPLTCSGSQGLNAGPEVHYAVTATVPGRLTVRGPRALGLSLHSLSCTATAALACESFDGILETSFGLPADTYHLRVGQPDVPQGEAPVDFTLEVQWLAP